MTIATSPSPNQVQSRKITVIGAGLAGSEAAWQLAECGFRVELHEMRPITQTAAHKTSSCAELVCSNSFRSDDADYNAVGLMHSELRQAGSLIIKTADAHKVPAGSALAVDREGFAAAVTEALENHPNITFVRGEVTALPEVADDLCLIATGPLTGSSLAEAIVAETGQDSLAFFDAIAPIVYKDSIDFSKAWFQSRYDKVGPEGDGADYINCALTEAEYAAFIKALLESDKTDFKEWEKDTPYFNGCLPIEVMAERGFDTLRFGPMKPVGLTNPHNPDEKPHAVVQLRQDNALGTLFNIVGFQTKLKYGAQADVLRMIPALANAEFARLGGIHRNTFIKSPVLLDETLRLKTKPHIRFAGQITGCEGYVESTAVGIMAAWFIMAEAMEQNLESCLPPETTAMGSLLRHITGGANADSFQPMNINFGLFPDVPPIISAKGKKIYLKGQDRKKAYTARAMVDFSQWLEQGGVRIAA